MKYDNCQASLRQGTIIHFSLPPPELLTFKFFISMADRLGLGVVRVRCTVAESWVVDALLSADTESTITAIVVSVD